MSVPNQRRIYIQRDSDTARRDYFKVSNNNLQEAMYNLKGNSFKLYIYLCQNADGYLMDLYSCDFCNIAKVTWDTYDSAFKQLIDKGYLIKSSKQENSYLFCEVSESAEHIPKKDSIQSLDKESFEKIKSELF